MRKRRTRRLEDFSMRERERERKATERGEKG